MIDVLLVLLVTFLVAIPLSRRTMDAQLPQPEQPGVGAEPGVRYAAVIAAMDAARGAGVRVIGITPEDCEAP